MNFVQTVVVHCTDRAALIDLVELWHAQQHAIAPGYRGTSLLADRDRSGVFTIEAKFASEEEAALNGDRPETIAWASRLHSLCTYWVTSIDSEVVLDLSDHA